MTMRLLSGFIAAHRESHTSFALQVDCTYQRQPWTLAELPSSWISWRTASRASAFRRSSYETNRLFAIAFPLPSRSQVVHPVVLKPERTTRVDIRNCLPQRVCQLVRNTRSATVK